MGAQEVAEVQPLLYLHGLSTGDFAPALAEFFGSSAGLSPSVITRLATQWQAEHRAFMDRDLTDRDYVYCWVDGVHFNVRLEQDRLCCLVIVGLRLAGTKELVALADGYRESTDSWGDLLRDLRRRHMRAPMIAVRRRTGWWSSSRDPADVRVGNDARTPVGASDGGRRLLERFGPGRLGPGRR